VPLDPMPPGAVDHETVAYDLADWSEGQRKAFELLLAGAGISFAWDNATDLVVSRSVEAAVDELLDDVEHQPGTPEDEDPAVRPTRPWRSSRPTDTVEELATIGQRSLARVVDQLLLIVSFQVVLLVFADEAPRRGGPGGTFFWAGMAWFFVYEVTLTVMWGQTWASGRYGSASWDRTAPPRIGAVPLVGPGSLPPSVPSHSSVGSSGWASSYGPLSCRTAAVTTTSSPTPRSSETDRRTRSRPFRNV
jgi:hypothetical protein